MTNDLQNLEENETASGHKHHFKYMRLEQGWMCHCGEYYRKVREGLWEKAHTGTA
jgi:hypothetical protein